MLSFVRRYSSSLLYTLCLVIGLLYTISEIQSIPSALKPDRLNRMEVRLVSTNSGVDKYRIQRDGQWLTFKQTMTLLSNEDPDLIRILSRTIISKHDAVFWECVPVDRASFSEKLFEFVLIEAPDLAVRSADRSPFEDKFAEASSRPSDVITFQNLGRDSTLVVPTPPVTNEIRPMTHLLSFLKYGDPRQVSHLWKKVGATFLSTIGGESNENRKFWLSTSGMGVSWLHVRIDTVPKYYNWQEYKNGR